VKITVIPLSSAWYEKLLATVIQQASILSEKLLVTAILLSSGKSKKRVFFTAGDQTNSIFSMFPHCGSFSIRLHRPLPYAKLSGTDLKIGACHVNFSV